MVRSELGRYFRNIILGCLLGIVLVAAIFFWIIPLANQTEKPAYLDILVTPLSARIIINGTEYRNATYELEPGNYQATITMDGFREKSIEFSLERDKTFGLYTYLEGANDDFSFFEAKKNQESLEALLRINQLKTIGFNGMEEEFIKKVNLKNETPIDFSICGEPATRMNCDAIYIYYDYAKECDNNLCVIINGRRPTLTNETLSAARGHLSEKGFNLDDYRYIYIQNDDR